MNKLAEQIVKNTLHLQPEMKVASTGSIYISFANCKKVRGIRLADHTGHKTKPRIWEVRKDAMTSRNKTNRIYNINAVNAMINELKDMSC